MQSPKILSLGWCKKGTNFYLASNYPHSYITILDRRCKFLKLRSFLLPWYRVCTEAIFISKGSFRDAEPKNIILVLVQNRFKPLRVLKLPEFMYRHIWHTMQISEISRFPFAMVPVCTKAIFILEGSFRDAEPKNIILVLVKNRFKPLRSSNYPHSCIAI